MKKVTSDKWRVTSFGFLLLLVTGHLSLVIAAPIPLPTYSPAGGTYVAAVRNNTKAVTIKGVPKARILFTTDGSDPRKGAQSGLLPQLAPVKVDLRIGRVTLKAVQLFGSQESKVRSNTYTITPRVGATPSPTPSPTATPSPIPTPTPTPPPPVTGTKEVFLQWQPNSEEAVTGYRVLLARSSRDYLMASETGKVTDTSVTLPGLGRWFIALQAVAGDISAPSEELIYEVTP